jgi:hypothetical protein
MSAGAQQRFVRFEAPSTVDAPAAGCRLSADEYLQHYGPQLFPPYFGRLLHPFLGSLATLGPDARVAAIEANFDRLVAVGCSHKTSDGRCAE